MSPIAKSKAALRCARAPSSAPRLRGGRLSGHLLPQAGEGLGRVFAGPRKTRSEEHTSELQSLMRISYAVFCLKTKQTQHLHMNINTKIYTNNTKTTILFE